MRVALSCWQLVAMIDKSGTFPIFMKKRLTLNPRMTSTCNLAQPYR